MGNTSKLFTGQGLYLPWPASIFAYFYLSQEYRLWKYYQYKQSNVGQTSCSGQAALFHHLFLFTYKGFGIVTDLSVVRLTRQSKIGIISKPSLKFSWQIFFWILLVVEILDLWSLSFQIFYHWPDYLSKLIAFEAYSSVYFWVVSIFLSEIPVSRHHKYRMNSNKTPSSFFLHDRTAYRSLQIFLS